MVALKEVKDMFWALTLESGKRYSQTVEKAFHLSMAALEDLNKKNDGMVAVMVSKEKAEFLLCSLRHKNLFNQSLDLNFTEGEEVTFFINGDGTVHLTGYQLEDERDDFDGFDMSDEDSDEEAPQLVAPKGAKRKSTLAENNAKKIKVSKFVDLSDEDDDDDDFDDDDEEGLSFIDDEADDLDDDEDMEDSDLDEEEEVKPKREQVKKENKQKSTPTPSTPSVQESGDASESAKKKKKKKKKKKNKDNAENTEEPVAQKQANTPAQAKTPKDQAKTPKDQAKTPKDQSKTPKEQGKTPKDQAKTPKGPAQTPKKAVLQGGIVTEDFNLGNGPAAQKGKMVHVYYVGKLQKDGKQFDSCSSGKPFKFRLGAREVIAGWDKGLEGMKVGGKRRLVIPPKEGYGNQKQGPIPANSTLIFDVELKSVT